jgi:hypothetical protein
MFKRPGYRPGRFFAFGMSLIVEGLSCCIRAIEFIDFYSSEVVALFVESDREDLLRRC